MATSEDNPVVVLGNGTTINADDVLLHPRPPPRPDVPPSADQEEIAPWVYEMQGHDMCIVPPTPPPKGRGFGSIHKPSFASFTSSTTAVRSRPSDTFSVESISTFAESSRSYQEQPKKSKPSFLRAVIKKTRSRSRLRPDRLLSSSSEPIPALPSPSHVSYGPPSPPPQPQSSRAQKLSKVVRKHKPLELPPPVPPKETEYALDTDLNNMDGIIDVTIRSDTPFGLSQGTPSSPVSPGFESSTYYSDGSSSYHLTEFASSSSPPGNSSSMFSNPNPFSARTSNGKKRKSGSHLLMFDGRKISPKTRPSFSQTLPSTIADPVTTGGPDWKAPESWAVDQPQEADDASAEYSTSEVEDDATLNNAINRRQVLAKSRMKPVSTIPQTITGAYQIRIYRADNTYHVASVQLDVTVDDLVPQLIKKLLLDTDRETHRLYLKERGRERVLAQTEKPAKIVRRRLTQAGYDDKVDGIEALGGSDVQFLMKFVYKSDVLGPTEEELIFENFEYIDLTGRSLKTVPVVLYPHAEAIITLNLSRNPMLEIPLDFIQCCTTLRELRLSNMAMKRVPQSIRHCLSLHRLDLSCNRISDLDEAGLDQIPKLRVLRLQNNGMERLPSYFPQMKFLKDLNISNNKFRELPEVVCKISSLVDLDISFNMVSELPNSIGNLHMLETLIIVGNQVSRFPQSCTNLVNLRTLDCRRNSISDLSVVCLLPRVESVLADHNSAHALDLSFGPSLATLDASHNDITQLTHMPGITGRSFAMVSLDVSHAKLSSLDDLALSRLTSLRFLKVDHNSIRSLPETIGDLAQLELLSCSNNQLYTLPSSLGRLKKLEKLEAHNNSIAELPISIWECASLRIINLTSNLLGVLHEPPPVIPEGAPAVSAVSSHGAMQVERKASAAVSIGARTLPPLAVTLERVYLGENRLSEDSVHPITYLKGLKVLNLSFNDISVLPPSFLKNLSRLEELYLSGNKLSALPTEDLPSLTNLRVLYLNGNRLQSLPQELGKISTLAVIDVGSNQLKYNINNWEFDWNWNYNSSLRYLNLSGNKRLEIKPDHKAAPPLFKDKQLDEGSQRIILADFQQLTHLQVLGLMDVTTTFVPNIPDDNEDRRIRTSPSEVNGMAYGIADTIGSKLSMFDLVQPEFRGRKNEAVFAMFGRASHIGSSNRVSKYIHDSFLCVFQQELDGLKGEEGVHDALRRSFLKLNKQLHDFIYSRDPRRPSTVSASGYTPAGIDISSVRSGASGVVLYFVDRTLHVANAGNALAVISRQGTAELISRKHDPFDREETTRIRAAEGWVSPKGYVNDEIDISRSFGFYYLLPVVNARPDVFTRELSEHDEFVIIGNRGLWDFVSYQTAVDIARTERDDPMIAAQKLRDFAISYGAEGTTMIMVISVAGLFGNGPTRTRQPTVDSIDPELYVARRRIKKDDITNRDISRLDEEVPPPQGHLALVFTDIRNSTHLWECNSGMQTAILLHNNLLRRQLRLCGGYEVKTEGDAFMCSFPTVLAAVWWCLSVQEQLLQAAWPLEILECEDGKEIFDPEEKLIARGLSVRMGIHCGNPVSEPDPITHRMDYFGPMVNRTARINGCAKGGQIACSLDVMREIYARVTVAEPPTEYSHLQPPQAVDAIRRMGVAAYPVGEVKLKGLEMPTFLTLIYPQKLAGRHALEAMEDQVTISASRVQFSVDQMKQLALLCIRLESLTSSRVFRALPERKGSDVQANSQDRANENPMFLLGNPDVLIPNMEKASDAELTLLLDSFSSRIENALASLVTKHALSALRGRGAMTSDIQVLHHLISLLGAGHNIL